MSILQMVRVWEHDFKHSHQSVMLALADHAHDDGTGIRPSIDRIAWKTGYARRNIQIILGELRDDGVLVVVREATPREPAEMMINWEAAKPKIPFSEYKAQLKDKSRGANFTPLDEEGGVINRSPQEEGGVINGSPLGRSGDHPRGDQEITSGVIHRSPEPSSNHQIKPSIQPSQDELGAHPAARKKTGKKKKTKPAESQYYPVECQALYERWSRMYLQYRGELDSRKLFVEGFDSLIEADIPLQQIVEGTEFYIEAKNTAASKGRKDQVKIPPDGIRFFKGKDGGDSYCLMAYELKQKKASGDIDKDPANRSKDFNQWMTWARNKRIALASQQQGENGVVVLIAEQFYEPSKTQIPEHWVTAEKAMEMFPMEEAA